MGTPRFRIMRTIQEEKVDTPERIAGWLKELDISSTDEDISDTAENSKSQKGKTLPATPPRKVPAREAHDELSPTNTSFSGPSIFDSPLRTYHQSGRLSPIHDQIHDAISDDTSISSDESATSLNKSKSVHELSPPHHAVQINIQPASITSYDPPSDIDEELEDAYTPLSFSVIEPHDTSKPRVVWIVSCLQCTLAGLPCSRTPPACSRCKRNGHADVCLLQRRWFPEEIEQANGEMYTIPLLLKLTSQDEIMWRKKLELAEELQNRWLAELDRKNWVLPDVGSPRGRYPVVGHGERVLHPGEGRGRVVHVEMIVDSDSGVEARGLEA